MNSDEPSTRECTVLFADLVGSTQLYGRIGDSRAFSVVSACIEAISAVITDKQGRIVKHTGDGVLAVFATAAAAAEAAVSMHIRLGDLARPSEPRLAIRVGFHSGPVLISLDDVFGETVNVAARLMELASPGRALTTAETYERLTADWRTLLRKLPPRVLRGASMAIEPYELKCESLDEVTILHNSTLRPATEPELRVHFANRVFVVDRKLPVLQIGRDETVDLKVVDNRASRRHAMIELRGDKFVLVDRSSNGTFVTPEGEKEFLLTREEVVLRGNGQISLGCSCVASQYVITYVYL